MKLWIRSQDKRMLVAVKEPITQFCNCIFYKGYILGNYKDEKRALKILDNIEEHISNINDEEDGNSYYPIFQMPKE